MKILLLGATGRTGKLILEQLIMNGHTVNAVVRDKTKIKIASPALSVFTGSTLDKSLIMLAMQGCDAIISALNISRNSDFPWSSLRTSKTLMSDTITNVISIAGSQNIKRLIVISAWGANETFKDIPWWFRWIISHSNIKYGYLDHERQENLLIRSDLDWTAIRPVGLINSNLDRTVKVALNNRVKPSIIISRKSVAQFTVRVLEQHEFIGLAPAISW
jgi:putative NADH-flavin reductase